MEPIPDPDSGLDPNPRGHAIRRPLATILRRLCLPGGLALLLVPVFSMALRAQIGAEPPQVHRVRMAGTNLEIEASGAEFKRYELRVSSNLTDWVPSQDLLNADTNFSFVEGRAQAPAFYQVVMRPGTNQPFWPGGSALSMAGGLTGTVVLSWPPATGPIAPTRYSVYRDGLLVTGLPVGTTNYQDWGLTLSGDHTYSILAHNSLDDWTEFPLSRTASVNALPPDPAVSAPVLEPGVVSLLPLTTDALATPV